MPRKSVKQGEIKIGRSGEYFQIWTYDPSCGEGAVWVLDSIFPGKSFAGEKYVSNEILDRLIFLANDGYEFNQKKQ